MKTLWHAFIPVSLIGLAAAGMAACSAAAASEEGSHAESSPAPKAKAESIPVTLTPVVRLPADAPLVATGRVSHAKDHKPAFKTGGVIKEILVVEGQRVEPGQVLARLDTREIDAGLAQARAGLAKAERDLARVDALVTDAVLPTTTRDDARTGVTVARAQVAGLAFNKETTRLVATAPGVVIKRLAEPGEVVGPGMPVLVIGESAHDSFEIEIGVPARDIARIAIGSKATVRLDGEVAERPADVVDLAPTLTPGTDRLAVTLEVAGTAPRGLVGIATFGAREEVTLPAVPLTTLVEGLGKEAVVWIADPNNVGRVLKRTVTVARLRSDGFALIAAGLDGVSEVIDAGNAWLDPEATIIVKAATKTAATAGERHEDR